MSTNSITSNYNSNLERISPLTIEEFNKLLEENKPYNKSTFKKIKFNKIETLDNTCLEYNIDINILICSKCSNTLTPNKDSIVKHLKVSITII
jgi:hypothetical protein